jgi:hydroxyethylthiazole kinase-like uncharacterized protein yjeF
MKAAAHQQITPTFLRAWPLPQPSVDGDKEERGRVLIVGGSMELAGSVLLAANAALRAGAGKLTLASDARLARSLALAVPEARVMGMPANDKGGLVADDIESLASAARRADAILIGPGMSDAGATLELVRELIQALPGKTVLLDAQAMDAVASLPLRDPSTRLLVTPHAGEMAHLCGLSRDEVCRQADACALEWARHWDCTLALKGASTWIATPEGKLFLHEASNPGLGVSGSGDCLAGVMAGLLARGATPEQAACPSRATTG